MVNKPFLFQVLDEASDELRQKRELAIQYKTSFLLLLLSGLFYVGINVYPKFIAQHYSSIEINIIYSLYLLLFISPIVFSPLYSFLPSKYLDKINLDIKRKIVFYELDNYNCSLKLHPNVHLEENLLSKIGLLNSGINFSYGDDFFIGEFNGYLTKFSEFHVSNVFRNLFRGYIVIIYDLPKANDDFYIKDSFKSFCQREARRNSIAILPEILQPDLNLLFYKRVANKAYLGVKGNKKMFEYSYRKLESNNLKYQSDLSSLTSLLVQIDRITSNASF